MGGVLSFGKRDEAPAINVTMKDVRCSMVNLEPDSANSDLEVLKAIVRANQNHAGIYGAATRIGRVVVGQPVTLHTGRSGDLRTGWARSGDYVNLYVHRFSCTRFNCTPGGRR